MLHIGHWISKRYYYPNAYFRPLPFNGSHQNITRLTGPQSGASVRLSLIAPHPACRYRDDFGCWRLGMDFEIGKILTAVGTGEVGYAGDGGPANLALIGESYGCAFDVDDNLYISDGRNHIIQRIDRKTWIITTVAGSGKEGYSGDGGPATQATLNNLYSLQVDTNGDIYIVDRLNAAIRKVEAATGIISTVAGTGVPEYSDDGGPGDRAS